MDNNKKIHYSFNNIVNAIKLERQKRSKSEAISNFFIVGNPNFANKEIKSPYTQLEDSKFFRTMLNIDMESITVITYTKFSYAVVSYNFINDTLYVESPIEGPNKNELIYAMTTQKLIQPKKLPYLFNIFMEDNKTSISDECYDENNLEMKIYELSNVNNKNKLSRIRKR